MGRMTQATTHDATAPARTRRVILAAPRGYCAGVDRAVETVEKALEKHGAPLYVRKEIVHNKHVVKTFEKQGVIFVDETTEIPEGSNVVFSAHGVSPAVHDEARKLQLKTFDATCPLVTKVHGEVKRFAKQGYQIILIGHHGHEEVEGTAGRVHRPGHAQRPPTGSSRSPARRARRTPSTRCRARWASPRSSSGGGTPARAVPRR